MSLQVWLPLTSDLHNQGLSDSTVTNSGATFNANGKLGNCYSFNGSSYLLGTHNVITNNTNDWSFSCWMKLNATAIGQTLFSCRTGANANGISIFYYGSQWIIDDGARWTFTPTITIAKDTWYHICVVRKGGVGKYLYVNGILDSSTTVVGTQSAVNTSYYSIGSSQNGVSTVSGNFLNGYLNDVRFYDHALSVKELKLLAQGLVAHYKLTGWLDGINPNMFKELPKSYTPTAYLAYSLNLTENLVAGQTYTLHFWNVNVSHSAKSESDLGLSVYWGGGNVLLKKCVGTDYFTNGHADHLIFSFTPTSSQASHADASNSFLHIYNSPLFVSGTLNLTMGKWKLEKGSDATPYVKTTEEMGGEDTTIYDCSGYNHHGSTLGTLTVSSDTARYSSSTVFDGSSSGVLLENFALASVINNDATLSFWIKPNGENGARSVYFSSYSLTSWSLEKTTGNVIRSYWNGNPDESCSGATISDGVWQHVCVTKKGTNEIKVYINGELKWTSTATHNALNNLPTTYRIGRDTRSGDGTPYKGQMSDFRIYATSLSADDVLELYHTGASISKNKELFAYEFNEPANGELMNTDYCSPYGTHSPSTSPFTNYNDNGEAILTTNGTSIGSDYIPVNPTGKTYYYDMMLSINAGNKFYVGFERYDADKTPRSNQACVYVYSTKPDSDVVRQRYRGTVNLSTDGVNPCAFIALRILNGWSGTTSGVTGQATIHYLSLREVDNSIGFHTSFGKNGIATTDLFLEPNGTGDIEKTGIINMSSFNEI